MVPPILQAAIPVEAVTAIASPLPECFRLSAEMISRNKTDFPVPSEDDEYNGSASLE